MSKDKKSKVTPKKLLQFKTEGKKIAALTAYDYLFSSILDQAGLDIILVGDSLGMVVQGKDNTLSVTLDEMIYHTKCVATGVNNALLITDMPFLTYNISPEDALRNAGRLIQEGSAEAVKIEGGEEISKVVEKIVTAGIPVMGHIGLTPQDILTTGGYFIQGIDETSAEKIMHDAKSLQDAGIFAIVLECIPKELSAKISSALKIPTIGIGAGPHCDGQVLVTYDILGLYKRICPRFVKQYANLYDSALAGLTEYVNEVRDGKYPDTKHSY